MPLLLFINTFISSHAIGLLHNSALTHMHMEMMVAIPLISLRGKNEKERSIGNIYY